MAPGFGNGTGATGAAADGDRGHDIPMLVSAPLFIQPLSPKRHKRQGHLGSDHSRTVAANYSAGASTRVTLSPTKAGFSPPSTSIVKRVTACHQPPPISSKETSSALARILESTGTRAGEGVLFQP